MDDNTKRIEELEEEVARLGRRLTNILELMDRLKNIVDIHTDCISAVNTQVKLLAKADENA